MNCNMYTTKQQIKAVRGKERPMYERSAETIRAVIPRIDEPVHVMISGKIITEIVT